MEFFDPKEQVIDIQLTQYGKHLLSLGKFQPIYYNFFDDNVLYDSSYVSSSEAQNSIHDRIKLETPRLLTQYSFTGLESKRINNTLDQYILGTVSVDSAYAPAWNVICINGNISGSISNATGSILDMQPITFKTISTTNENNLNFENNILITKYEDGSFIKTIEDEIRLQISEENSSIDNENFEIEVFLVEETTNNLKRLKFARIKEKLVQNNILVEPSHITKIEPTPNHVEYFFDIFTDNDVIDIECNNCNNLNNIYSSKLTEEALKKDC